MKEEHSRWASEAICHAAEQTKNRAIEYISNMDLPSVIFRPRIFPDGDMWCCLYGDDLQSGVAGFGETPADACADFDRAWYRPITKKEAKG